MADPVVMPSGTKICLGDVDNSAYDISDPTLPNPIPKTITRNFTIWVSNGAGRLQAEADLLASSLCPMLDPNYGTLHRKNIQVTSVPGIFDQFEATCTWELWSPEQQGTQFLGGSISMVMETVYRPEKRMSKDWAANAHQRDLPDLINVSFGATEDDRGGVNGIDIPRPMLSFSIRGYYGKGTFTLNSLQGLNGYVGRPNKLAWKGFAPHTVRLSGVTGSDSNPDYDEITWNFEAMPSQNNITVQSPLGDITGINKRGWDYLWLVTETHNDPGGWAAQAPACVVVDQIMPEIDLNLILP